MSSQFLRCHIKTFFCIRKSNPAEIIKINFTVKFVGKLKLQTSVKFAFVRSAFKGDQCSLKMITTTYFSQSLTDIQLRKKTRKRIISPYHSLSIYQNI